MSKRIDDMNYTIFSVIWSYVFINRQDIHDNIRSNLNVVETYRSCNKTTHLAGDDICQSSCIQGLARSVLLAFFIPKSTPF